MNAPTLVIGATGTTGRRVVAGLIAEGHSVKAAGRSATPVEGAEAVRFDWNEPATFGAALDGVDRVYLIPPIGSSDPAAVMLPFLRRARSAGVHRAVLLSSSAIPAGGPAVGQVHQVLPGLFEQWAVLRPSWFMQNFAGFTPPRAQHPRGRRHPDGHGRRPRRVRRRGGHRRRRRTCPDRRAGPRRRPDPDRSAGAELRRRRRDHHRGRRPARRAPASDVRPAA
ncbi:hypothetical protein OK006_5567 [Actinobacteria bacterium OK006]|nr:hypothetical protein OK006_5567 [Actinobacteria bacterium OK006]